MERPGRSNAFEISKRIGIPEEVLSRAASYVASDKQSFEDVIDGLESARQDFEEKTAELARQARELAEERMRFAMRTRRRLTTRSVSLKKHGRRRVKLSNPCGWTQIF